MISRSEKCVMMSSRERRRNRNSARSLFVRFREECNQVCNFEFIDFVRRREENSLEWKSSKRNRFERLKMFTAIEIEPFFSFALVGATLLSCEIIFINVGTDFEEMIFRRFRDEISAQITQEMNSMMNGDALELSLDSSLNISLSLCTQFIRNLIFKFIFLAFSNLASSPAELFFL